jgi:hypothetical protein
MLFFKQRNEVIPPEEMLRAPADAAAADRCFKAWSEPHDPSN